MRIFFAPVFESSSSLILTLLLLLFWVEGIDCLEKDDVGDDALNDKGDSLNFLAFGDWGGAPLIGALPAQRKTAVGMGRVAKDINAEFVVALGDNFYRTGVSTVASRRFDVTFESVYTDPSLMSIPWYVIGGNHDHRGNIDAQINYTYDTKYNTNQRWKFPSLYHSHSFTTNSSSNNKEDEVTVDLIMIDTVGLCSLHELDDEEAEGYYDPLPYLPKSHATEQWDWLEEQLSKSSADYTLVAGHYPVFSVCSHGPTETLVKHLRPLLLKYGAHYLAGHDHCMNHFVDDASTSTAALAAGEVHYVLSGAGIGCCGTSPNLHNPLNDNVPLLWRMTNETNWLPFRKKKAKGGFTSFSATKEHMKITYHAHYGDVLYQVPPIPPRTKHIKPAKMPNHHLNKKNNDNSQTS